jgi:hypothetical protein
MTWIPYIERWHNFHFFSNPPESISEGKFELKNAQEGDRAWKSLDLTQWPDKFLSRDDAYGQNGSWANISRNSFSFNIINGHTKSGIKSVVNLVVLQTKHDFNTGKKIFKTIQEDQTLYQNSDFHFLPK